MKLAKQAGMRRSAAHLQCSSCCGSGVSLIPQRPLLSRWTGIAAARTSLVTYGSRHETATTHSVVDHGAACTTPDLRAPRLQLLLASCGAAAALMLSITTAPSTAAPTRRRMTPDEQVCVHVAFTQHAQRGVMPRPCTSAASTALHMRV